MTIKKADAEAVLIKDPPREEEGDANESGRSGCTDQGPADE